MVVVKALYSWLRKERHVLTSAEDATLDLNLPQASPEQLRRSNIVPREHIDLVMEHLTSPWREALTVQAGTGWHTTEIVRFVAEGTIEPLARTDGGRDGTLAAYSPIISSSSACSTTEPLSYAPSA